MSDWHKIEFELGGDKAADGQYVVILRATCGDFYDAVAWRMFLENMLATLTKDMQSTLPADEVIVQHVHGGATH